MKQNGIAKFADYQQNCYVPDGVMNWQMWLLAASEGEHVAPANSHPFCLTKSSTNVLALTGNFLSAYCTYYITEIEEHADASSTVNDDGKRFCLHSEATELLFERSVH